MLSLPGVQSKCDSIRIWMNNHYCQTLETLEQQIRLLFYVSQYRIGYLDLSNSQIEVGSPKGTHELRIRIDITSDAAKFAQAHTSLVKRGRCRSNALARFLDQ